MYHRTSPGNPFQEQARAPQPHQLTGGLCLGQIPWILAVRHIPADGERFSAQPEVTSFRDAGVPVVAGIPAFFGGWFQATSAGSGGSGDQVGGPALDGGGQGGEFECRGGAGGAGGGAGAGRGVVEQGAEPAGRCAVGQGTGGEALVWASGER